MATEDDLQNTPDYRSIGQQVGAGINDVQNLSRWGRLFVTSLQEVVAWSLSWFLNMAADVAVFMARTLTMAEDRTDDSLSELSAAAVEDLLGVKVDQNALRRRAGRGGRDAMAASLGNTIIRSLVGDATSIAPSDEPAGRYVANVTKFGLEGWLSGWTMEFLTSVWGPFGHIETFGELDDILAQSLGFGRLSRRVLGPYVDTLVVTPTRWQVNKTYRPELLTPAQAVMMFHRKRWTHDQMMEECARQGYSDDRIEALMAASEKKPTLAQVMKWYDMDYIVVEDLRAYLEDDGWPERYIDILIQGAEVEKISSFNMQLADAAAAAYVARRIPEARFNQLLSDSGIPQRDMNRLRELAELKRAVNVKPLSESDAAAATKRGLLSVPEYRQVLRANGYDEDAIRVMELLMLQDIRNISEKERAEAERDRLAAEAKAKREAEAAARKARLEAERAVTEPSLGMVERFVTRGYWDFQQYADFLRAERYDGATIAALVADAEQARVEYVQRQAEREDAERRSAVRTIGLAQLETAILRGHATMADYRRRLQTDGYSAADQDVLVRVLQDRIDERAELEARRRAADEQSPDKGVSVAQVEQSVLRGLTSLADFDAFLQQQGYPSFDRSVILELTRAKLQDQQAAAARRVELEAAAAARQVPVADIRRAVLQGVRPFADYRNALIDARIDAEDRQLLEDLLRVELDQRAADVQRRDDIARERDQRGLSLQQLERAVVAGAATVEQYQGELAAEGYDAESIDTLTALLLERIAETQRARRRRDELDAGDGSRPLTPGQVARAVRAGLRAPQDYFFALLDNGNTEADAQMLTQLLELEIAEARDARATRTAVTTELAGESVNLAQLAADVRTGTATLEDYALALESRNYTPATVATLTALLEREIEEQAFAALALDEATEGDKTKQLSVTQFEQAVVAGARTLDEYVQFLNDQKFSLAAQSSLVGLLLQRLDKAAGVA